MERRLAFYIDETDAVLGLVTPAFASKKANNPAWLLAFMSKNI